MNSTSKAYQLTQLAEAAYANFLNNARALLTNEDDIQAALIASGFSTIQGTPEQSAQASAFVSQWWVVDQYTAPFTLGFIGTGFSGALFQNTQTGEYALTKGTTKGTGVEFFSQKAACIDLN